MQVFKLDKDRQAMNPFQIHNVSVLLALLDLGFEQGNSIFVILVLIADRLVISNF